MKNCCQLFHVTLYYLILQNLSIHLYDLLTDYYFLNKQVFYYVENNELLDKIVLHSFNLDR